MKYSADGGDQTDFGIAGGHAGDVLDVWPNEVVQRVQVGEEGGLMDLISLRFFVLSFKIWLSGACRTYTLSPPSHMHSQLCVTRLDLWKFAEYAAGEFHQWLPGPFR